MATNPYLLSDNPLFDRPQLALANLAEAELGPAMRALYDPEEMSPDERKKLSARWGLTGPAAAIVDITTNPMVLLGAGLTLLYPRLDAGKIVKQGSKIVRNWGPANWLIPHPEIFGPFTKLGSYLQEGVRRSREFFVAKQDLIGKAVDAAVDRTGKPVTRDEFLLVAAHLDGLGDPNSPAMKRWLGALKDDPGKFGLDSGTATVLYQRMQKGLVGELPEHLVPLKDDFRKILNSVYRDAVPEGEARTAVEEVLRRRDLLDEKQTIEELQNYWPHLEAIGEDEAAARGKAWSDKLVAEIRAKIAGGSVPDKPLDAIDRGVAKARANDPVSKNLRERMGFMLPDPRELRQLGVDPAIVDALDGAVRQSKAVRFYSLNPHKTLHSYVDSMAKTHAWTVPIGKHQHGLGRLVLEEGENLAVEGDAGRQAYRNLTDVVLPMAMGRMTPSQIKNAMYWDSSKEWFRSKFAEGTMMGRALDKLKPGMRQDFDRFLAEDRLASYPGAGAAISSLFFLNTLGGNISSAALNVSSNLHTMAFAGLGRWSRAAGETTKLLGDAVMKAQSKGISIEDALRTIPEFKGFFEYHQELAPMVAAFERESQRTLSKFMPSAMRKVSDTAKKTLMAPFATTELWNRLVAYRSFFRQGLDELENVPWQFPTSAEKVIAKAADGTLDKASAQYAAYMTGYTQFGSGFENMPSGTVQWWAPFRQFTTYPLRLTGMLAQTATQNPNAFGRLALGSGLAYGIGREVFGTDLSRGLAFGGVPGPTEGSAFSPLPIVPPLLGGLGAIGLSAATGDSKHVREFLPTLVPGGSAIARGIGMVPGGAGVAEFTGRSYADYQKRTPEGLVPVYNGQGSLTGYFTAPQLYMRSMGFKSATATQEMEMTKWLLGQRNRVRGIKKDYLQALAEGDGDEALRISERFHEAYPRLGGMPVKKSDIRALHNRANVARLEKVLDTFPPEMRAELLPVVGAVLGPQAPQILGLTNPEGFNQPAIAAREPYRAVPIGATRQRVSQGLHGVGLQEKLRMFGADQDATVAAGGRVDYQPFEGF